MHSVATLFVQLTGWREPFRRGEQTVWINPDRIAYFEPHMQPRGKVDVYGNYPEYKVIGTRIFFAGDGMLEVREEPALVARLIEATREVAA